MKMRTGSNVLHSMVERRKLLLPCCSSASLHQPSLKLCSGLHFWRCLQQYDIHSSSSSCRGECFCLINVIVVRETVRRASNNAAISDFSNISSQPRPTPSCLPSRSSPLRSFASCSAARSTSSTQWRKCVTPIGQSCSNARGLRDLRGPKPDPKDADQKMDIDSIIDKFANTTARVAKFN